MSYIDNILVKELIDSPTAINSDTSTISADIMNRRDEFSVQVDYDNGIGVDMNIVLEVSNDDISFVPMASQNVTDASGTHIFDAEGTGTNYLRISFVVNAGSFIAQRVLYMGKRNH
jgi:hypothetical protein